MEHNLQNTIALLTRTPAALDALLRGLPETWTMHNEGKIAGKDTWTVRDVLAHLIHCERNNWIVRAKWIIDFGESRPFELSPSKFSSKFFFSSDDAVCSVASVGAGTI